MYRGLSVGSLLPTLRGLYLLFEAIGFLILLIYSFCRITEGTFARSEAEGGTFGSPKAANVLPF